VVIASVINRFCPWELALYAIKGDRRRMTIRLKRGWVPVPLGAGTVWTHYYSPAAFERPFLQAGFSRVALRGLGVFLPPPYVHEAASRHPRVTAMLQAVEDYTAALPLLRGCGDHFLITLRRL
jgi:hypothetical protein